MKNKFIILFSIVGFLLTTTVSQDAFALDCDGKITEVLSGNRYCSAGDRLGFVWTGGSSWLCSTNKNMDGLILSAYTTGKSVSVRHHLWTSCFDHPPGATPDHIWLR